MVAHCGACGVPLALREGYGRVLYCVGDVCIDAPRDEVPTVEREVYLQLRGRSFHVPASDNADRDLLIVATVSRGVSVTLTAKVFNVTRQRVYQVLKEHGYPRSAA